MPKLTARVRLVLLLAVLAAQTVFFLAFLQQPLAVIADNTRYETPAHNLATGRGLSLPFSDLPDADMRGWACSRNPAWCPGHLYPTASYPPGYQFFIAGVYAFTGRSLPALVGAQLGLLLLLFVLFERVSFKLLAPAGYFFVMAVALTYPFIARQAGWVMSDHIHVVLLFAALWALTCMEPGQRRGVAFGLLLAAATLSRPYSLLSVPFLLLAPRVRRGASMEAREAIVAAVSFCAPFALWATRNAIVFGRFIPLSASGIGVSLYLNKLEWTIGSALDADNGTRIVQELRRVAGGDHLTVHGGRVLQERAIEWMRANPSLVLRSLPLRAVRLWISMGTAGAGTHKLAPVFVLYLGGLWALGMVGIVRRVRAAGPWLAFAVLIGTYWAFLLHTPGEARRTLPLRLPLLLFAGAAVADGLSWFQSRRRRQDPPADASLP